MKVFGKDLDRLKTITEQIAERMKGVAGLRDVDTTLKIGKPELQIVVDREKASSSQRCSHFSSSPSSTRFSTGSGNPETAGGRGTGGGTPDPFKSLYDTIRTTTNRVESGKVRYDVIEPDNLRLQKMGKTLQNIP